MEIISRVSKGTKMDQIYLPKNRNSLPIGSYVVVMPIETEQKEEKTKSYFYNIKNLEPVKTRIAEELLKEIEKNIHKYENIIITGSFLDKGFAFQDIDVLIVSEDQVNVAELSNKLEQISGIKSHLILISNKTLIAGLSTDPLYQTMLSKCISKRRIIYKVLHKIDYKILDFHLFKSEQLIDNFDFLDGNEKYYLTRNMIAILEYVKTKKVSKEKIDKEISKIFNLTDINLIKKNLLDKKEFIKIYKKVYNKTFNLIMKYANDTK